MYCSDREALQQGAVARTAHRENRYAHPTWRRGEHRIGELRTAAARGGALASPPHRHLFGTMRMGTIYLGT